MFFSFPPPAGLGIAPPREVGCCSRLSRRIDLESLQFRSQKSRDGRGPASSMTPHSRQLILEIKKLRSYPLVSSNLFLEKLVSWENWIILLHAGN